MDGRMRSKSQHRYLRRAKKALYAFAEDTHPATPRRAMSTTEYKPWSARNSLPENIPVRNQAKSGPLFILKVALITLVLIVSGASSGLSFYATGQVMKGYPSFLLYFCNGCYALAYLLLLCASRLYAACRGRGGGGPGASDAYAPLLSAQSASGGGRTAASSEFFGSAREQKFFFMIGCCTGLSLGAPAAFPDPSPASSLRDPTSFSPPPSLTYSPAACVPSSAEMQQYANGKVNGDLQVVLYQLYLPFTAICSRLYLKTELTIFNIFGGIGVMCGCCLIMVPGISTGPSVIWPIVYGLAALPLGMACVLQEEIFNAFPNCTVIKMSTWSTIYGVLFNLVTLPVSMLPNAVFKDVPVGNTSEMVAIYPDGATWDEFTTHQANAFRCFFYDGTGGGSGSGALDPLPEGCVEGAWQPIMIYVVSYGINVFVCMALVKEMSAVFCVVFGATVRGSPTIRRQRLETLL